MSTEKKVGCVPILLGVVAVAFLLTMLGRGIEKINEHFISPKSATQDKMEIKKPAPAPEAKPADPPMPESPPLTPAERLAAAKKALSNKSKTFPKGKIGDAEDHLKEIPPDAQEYKEAQRLLKEVERRRKILMAQGKAELEKYLASKRKEYADELEKAYLSKGMDITVRTSGPQNDILTLTWVMFSRPLVYKLEKEGFLNILRDRGFKKVYFKTGYGRWWSYDLK